MLCFLDTNPNLFAYLTSTSQHTSHRDTNTHRGIFVYCEYIKRELKRRHICGCQCNERLEAKTEGSTCLTYIGLCGGLEHLKIESRLRGDSFSESCLLLIDKELKVELM